MRKLTFACLFLVAAQAVYGNPAVVADSEPSNAHAEDGFGLEKIYNMFQGCSESNPENPCNFKMRALHYVDKALRKSDNIDIFEGITLVKSEPVESSRGLNGRSLSESELDDSLAKDDGEKDVVVENLLLDRVVRFLESHTLQLKVPESSISGMRRSLDEGKSIFYYHR